MSASHEGIARCAAQLSSSPHTPRRARVHRFSQQTPFLQAVALEASPLIHFLPQCLFPFLPGTDSTNKPFLIPLLLRICFAHSLWEHHLHLLSQVCQLDGGCALGEKPLISAASWTIPPEQVRDCVGRPCMDSLKQSVKFTDLDTGFTQVP